MSVSSELEAFAMILEQANRRPCFTLSGQSLRTGCHNNLATKVEVDMLPVVAKSSGTAAAAQDEESFDSLLSEKKKQNSIPQGIQFAATFLLLSHFLCHSIWLVWPSIHFLLLETYPTLMYFSQSSFQLWWKS